MPCGRLQRHSAFSIVYAVPRMSCSRPHVFTGAQSLCNFQDLPFTHAENEKIRGGIRKDRLPDPVLPVIIMGEAAEACFDTSENDRYARKQFMYLVGIHDCRPVGAFQDAPGRIHIITPPLSGRA